MVIPLSSSGFSVDCPCAKGGEKRKTWKEIFRLFPHLSAPSRFPRRLTKMIALCCRFSLILLFDRSERFTGLDDFFGNGWGQVHGANHFGGRLSNGGITFIDHLFL